MSVLVKPPWKLGGERGTEEERERESGREGEGSCNISSNLAVGLFYGREENIRGREPFPRREREVSTSSLGRGLDGQPRTLDISGQGLLGREAFWTRGSDSAGRGNREPGREIEGKESTERR